MHVDGGYHFGSRDDFLDDRRVDVHSLPRLQHEQFHHQSGARFDFHHHRLHDPTGFSSKCFPLTEMNITSSRIFDTDVVLFRATRLDQCGYAAELSIRHHHDGRISGHHPGTER